jgi:serine/threonine protein kinase
MKNTKDTELRQQFFEQNGGGMLMQRLSGAGPSNVDVKIFTEEGMKEATDGYDENRILGQGGQGTVYKGILPDNSIVAIKKARLGDNSQVEQFINEVLVLSQINHRNVVKLLGCCLETEVPLLVYEFISSGTLFDHLHGSMFDSSLTWEHRLRMGLEIAGTLAYLQSSGSIPIINRDIKTANILLDENLTAKVADFGASRLIPMDKEDLATMVQGTLGYLDPEYYNTGLLNEKSDVYSFGVVLMELLSGQKALCFERPQTSKHIVSYFASATKENRLHEIIDGQVMNENNQREIQKAARIAVECTRLTGEERPGMKEVAAELEALRVTKTKHKWSDEYPEQEDTEHLVGVQKLSAQGETSSSIGYDSIRNVAILDIEAGR